MFVLFTMLPRDVARRRSTDRRILRGRRGLANRWTGGSAAPRRGAEDFGVETPGRVAAPHETRLSRRISIDHGLIEFTVGPSPGRRWEWECAVTKPMRDDQSLQKTDDIDKRILDAMLYNARISNAALAKVVGLSESATLERVRRLEKNKVILGYSTRIDAGAMERNVTALVTIRLVNHSGEVYDEFVRFVKSTDEILSCFQVMGGCDFVAHVAARDVTNLEQFLTQKLLRLKAVERTESMFVLKILKRLFDPPEEHT